MKIPQKIVDEIFDQAREETPLEACGYLAGTGDMVQARYPMTNIDQSEEHFSFDPKEQFAAVKQARAAGLSLLAVYHSHPASPARPSEEDIRLAYDPQMLYIIASLQDFYIKAFRISEGKVAEELLEYI